jgi:putative polyhydroxyalkanoate system protein
MANEIRIQRHHALGLAKARKLAWAWAEKVERDYGMACTVLEGDDEDTVEFARAGVEGRVLVSADRFDLSARLGLLLAAFSSKIESEIERQFDALLGAAATKRRAPAKKR